MHKARQPPQNCLRSDTAATHPAAATGLIKGVSVCTGCVGAPDWPTDVGDPSVGGLPLAKLKGEPPAARFRARRNADQSSAFGAEDIVNMATDVLQVYYMCYVLPL